MEGGANVVGEAVVAGVPVLASRIPGNVGLLGERYDGYFEVGDTRGLAMLLDRCETELPFLQRLRRQLQSRRPLFAPARETRSWRRLLAELHRTPTSR
jgi:glycosyltransferase involved in cell wall biosynthesis